MTYKNNPTFSRRSMRSMGKRIGSTRRFNLFDTRLYTFSYRSKGTIPTRPRPNNDKQPLLLLASHGGERTYSIPGKPWRYMYGFNLNGLRETKRLQVLTNLRDKFHDFEGAPVDYPTLRDSLDLPAQTHDTIFRKYRTGGGNMSAIVAVDLDKYITDLENWISRNRTGSQ